MGEEYKYKITPWPESRSELSLSVKLVPRFAARWCHVANVTDLLRLYSRISRPEPIFFSFKHLLNFTHETEWIPFQTHNFSENLVAQGIEPGPLDL
jgi:hypothetical protein